MRLASEGADIIAVDAYKDIDSVYYPMATESDFEETVRLVEALGRRIVAVKADVRDIEQMQHAVEEGFEAFGRLDIVVANAGICLSGPTWR